MEKKYARREKVLAASNIITLKNSVIIILCNKYQIEIGTLEQENYYLGWCIEAQAVLPASLGVSNALAGVLAPWDRPGYFDGSGVLPSMEPSYN
jgi:hypothetical protein